MSISLGTNIVHHAIMKDEALLQFKLLLPAALKKRLETHATINRRSLSQEIVVALEEKYPQQNRMRRPILLPGCCSGLPKESVVEIPNRVRPETSKPPYMSALLVISQSA